MTARPICVRRYLILEVARAGDVQEARSLAETLVRDRVRDLEAARETRDDVERVARGERVKV